MLGLIGFWPSSSKIVLNLFIVPPMPQHFTILHIFSWRSHCRKFELGFWGNCRGNLFSGNAAIDQFHIPSFHCNLSFSRNFILKFLNIDQFSNPRCSVDQLIISTCLCVSGNGQGRKLGRPQHCSDFLSKNIYICTLKGTRKILLSGIYPLRGVGTPQFR